MNRVPRIAQTVHFTLRGQTIVWLSFFAASTNTFSIHRQQVIDITLRLSHQELC